MVLYNAVAVDYQSNKIDHPFVNVLVGIRHDLGKTAVAIVFDFLVVDASPYS